MYYYVTVTPGTVLCGGSAGALCWFDCGHSDSRDPTTVRFPRKDLTEEEKRGWKYIKVAGLGLVPGMVCPHHDTTQSNGVPRADDFDQMLLRHPDQIGVGIDDHGAILVNGDQWRVLKANDASKVTLKRVNDDGNTLSSTVYQASEKFYSTSLFEKSPVSEEKKRKRE
jgi:peptidase E